MKTGLLYTLLLTVIGVLMTVSSYAQEPPSVPVEPVAVPDNPIDPRVQDKLENRNTSSPANSSTEGNTTTTSNDEGDDESNDTKSEKEKLEEEQKIKFDLRQAALPAAKIWGQQFFRNQSISLFTRSRDIKAIDSYLLGIGDELAITVWGAASYSSSIAIDEEGFINLTNPQRGIDIPRLYIKEMRFADAKKAIIDRLKNHMNIKNSQVSIELNYSRSLTINITGEVFNPGSYTIPAVNTAFNALVAAGGPSQIGSVRLIRVVSSARETRILDVYKFMSNPNVADEFFLSNNDYIFVPLAERVVEITGAIERPFYYELVGEENLVELIKYAGGLTPDAYRRNIQVIRYENDEEKLIDVNLAEIIKGSSNFELKDGDRVTINPIKQAYANYITVTGAVKLPGTYELESGMKISEVLSKSGVVLSAVMKRIYIKRLREDLSLEYIPVNVYEVLSDSNSTANLALRPFDEIEVKYKSDFIDKYQVNVYGAVRKGGAFEFSDNLTLADVLYMANGLKREASNSYIEISRLVLDANGNKTRVNFERLEIGSIEEGLKVIGDSTFILQPYDQIFVRSSKEFEAPKNVTVRGEINWPGIYTLANDEERVMDIIDRAGGWTEIAFLKGAKLMRKGDGLVLLDLEILKKEGKNSRYNYVLRADDQIIIPKLKDLVSIAGYVNHPAIKEKFEIANKELDLELERATTELERKEILLEEYKEQIANPLKVNVPFHESKRANFYVKEYGAGIDRKLGGRQRLIYVRYANGMVKKTRHFLFFKIFPKVEKGAMVYVGAREKKIKAPKQPVNWYKIVTDTMALAVSGLSLYVLINTLSRQNTQ